MLYKVSCFYFFFGAHTVLFFLHQSSRGGPLTGTSYGSHKALSNLTCASLNEDPYGVAQRDIPKILEGFVRFLNVLEGLEKEFEMIAKDKSDEDEREKWRNVEKETVGAVQDGEFRSLDFRFQGEGY